MYLVVYLSMRLFSCLLMRLMRWACFCTYWCACCGTCPGTRIFPVEALVCVPVEQHFKHVNQPWAKWAAWTCGELRYNAMTGMRGAWISAWNRRKYAVWMRMDTWTARTSGSKRGQLNFSTKDLVLKQAKIMIVNLQFPCAIMTSRLQCLWLALDLRWFRGWSRILRCRIRRKYLGNVFLIIGLRRCTRWSWTRVGTVEDLPGHCLPLWCKADCQTQHLQVVHLIQIFSHWALEKYSKIH